MNTTQSQKGENLISIQISVVKEDYEPQVKKELNKPSTIMDSQGAIAGENKMLICYVSYFELQKMKEIIGRHKGVFSTVSTIDEILR